MAHLSSALMAITLLNVMLRHEPALQYEAKRESIFQPPTQQSPAFPIIGGLEMCARLTSALHPAHSV